MPDNRCDGCAHWRQGRVAHQHSTRTWEWADETSWPFGRCYGVLPRAASYEDGDAFPMTAPDDRCRNWAPKA